MSASEYIDYCFNAFMLLDYNVRVIFVLALLFAIWIYSWLNLFLIKSIRRIIAHFKNRGKNNAESN